MSKYTWKRYMIGPAQDHWLLKLTWYREQINECMGFIVWDGDVIRLNEWCYWKVYLSKYTCELMCLGDHKNIDYFMWVSLENKSTNSWFLLYEMEI